MKPFSLLKIPMMLGGLGAILFLAPSCKAQSEVSPDHFDGTDSWEVAARTPAALRTKPATAVSYQAQNKKSGSSAIMQLAAVREVTKPSPRKAVAQQDKHKTIARKSDPK